MTAKAISLFSGGLDSILAVKVIQDQGISVQGVTFETPFFNARKAREVLVELQGRLSSPPPWLAQIMGVPSASLARFEEDMKSGEPA